MNPLFPDEPTHPSGHPHGNGYVLPRSGSSPVRPANSSESAVELIRSKINALYEEEPSATKELDEAKTAAQPRSRHQQFMFDLSAAGKSLAEIQTAWHEYYQKLSDAEKHEVWQEFYAANNQQSSYTRYVQQQTAHQQPQPTHAPAQQPSAAEKARPAPAQPNIGLPRPAVPQAHHTPHTSHISHAAGPIVVAEGFSPEPAADTRSFASIKKQVVNRARAGHNAQLKARQHFQSLAFGLGLGTLVIFVLLFSLFNEMVITPFIRPNARAEATPIILSTDGVAPTDKNSVIIPKINVELPVVYSETTTEADIQNSLEEGVVHYPSTVMPGQAGNAAIFGHSSNNIFNKGKYKFAFVLLKELEPGDVFYITHNGKAYTYKVFQKKVVAPTDIGVLNPVPDKAATVTLITCDPPGTDTNRLVVWGEQITPNPAGNGPAAPAAVTGAPPATLPSDSPSLWKRLTGWL